MHVRVVLNVQFNQNEVNATCLKGLISSNKVNTMDHAGIINQIEVYLMS